MLPRYQYSFVGEPDALGGRSSVQAGAFNVLRQIGTDTQRANLSLNWERPATGALGDLWKLVLHLDSAAYDATKLNQQPNFGMSPRPRSAQAMPTVALESRWPLMRSGGGTQVIEPIVQLIAAPRGSSYGTVRSANGTPLYVNTLIPNEDSLDFEFTDANLFALNRFPGVDRLEGGVRANVALHGTWYFGDGQQADGLIGQGYRTNPDPAFPVNSGLSQTVTDVVSHDVLHAEPVFRPHGAPALRPRRLRPALRRRDRHRRPVLAEVQRRLHLRTATTPIPTTIPSRPAS